MAPKALTYHAVARLLHWTIAALIALQYILHELGERASAAGATASTLGLIANHKSVGITVLALALARLVWRFANTPPPLPKTMPRWQVSASGIAHVALYGLMFALPLSGWLLSSAAGYSVSWFNVLQLPDLIGADEARAHTLENTHDILAKALFVIALLHIGAAFKHVVIDRDGVMKRMASTPTVVAGLVVLAVGAWQLSDVSRTSAPKPAEEFANTGANDPALPTLEPSSLPLWVIDRDASYIRFTGEQAGASFDGEWLEWTAAIQFDAARLAEGRFNVAIQTSAVDAGDAERDSTMRSAEWFSVDEFPEAQYLVDDFQATDDGRFEAFGQLIIKGRATPTTLTFDVETSANTRVLTGAAELSRLALDVGIGEWADTTWVGDQVIVTVRVAATVDEAP